MEPITDYLSFTETENAVVKYIIGITARLDPTAITVH
jgi:hypothetical protein